MPALRLQLFDTLTGRVQPLVPRRDDEVRVYCCGPTTYDVAHVGHARAALAPDILVRHLRSQGIKVVYARNITDVDDKILARAKETGEEPMALSTRMAALYEADIAALGCVTPDVQPKVSEHIAEIVEMVQTLIGEGAAYTVTMPSGATDVYYSVRAFSGYGKLSKRNIDDLRSGARVEVSGDKRDALDFALWKGCVEEAWGWQSPWGKGRPGWHIECSAMATRYLGHGFDVHAGGMDLIFPHHENEIAQSEAARPGEGPFAAMWMHNGFVNVDKEKMAKSLGNFVTIRQVYERNDPEALRYFLLGVHYRGPIAFDTHKEADGRVVFPGVLEAERRVDYLYATLSRLSELQATNKVDTLQTMHRDLVPFAKLAYDSRSRVDEALDDDLNTSVALGAMSELARGANELADLVAKRRKEPDIGKTTPVVAGQLLFALRSCAAPLGLLQTPPEQYAARTRTRRLTLVGMTADQVEAALTERAAARKAKDFARSDAIRQELESRGFEIADSQAGTTWRLAPI